MPEKLKVEFPSQGWRQIGAARKEILNAYDRAREQARQHRVETFHGNVAEAAFRKWLQDFLPNRYGVASGFVVSVGLPSTAKASHFDVIIYDRLESPVLWVEDNPDASAQGRSLAIPVEYVRGVLEVKSEFSSTTVKAAIEHLGELSPVMQAIDDPNERYKLHLPPTFFCGFVCVELRQENIYRDATLRSCINRIGLRGYIGGLVLRLEGDKSERAGRIMQVRSETPFPGYMGRDNNGVSSSLSVAERVHIGARSMWTESGFAQFAFDIVALLQGTFKVGQVSSFYGMGGTTVDR